MEASFRRYRWELLAATWCSYAGFYMTRKVFGVVKPELKVALGLHDDFAVSHLWTVYLVAYMLGQFLTAAMGRRFSSRDLLLVGMSVSVLCNVAIGSFLWLGGSLGYTLILVAMGVHGFAQATGWANNVGLVTQWTTKGERGTVMAIWSTCYQIGSVIAKAFAAFVFGLAGIIWSFWGTAAVLGVFVVVFWFWGRERPEDHGFPPLEVDAPPEAPSADREALAGARYAAWLRLVVSMGLVYFTFKFLRYAIDSWTSVLLVDTFGIGTERAGYYSTAFDWVGFIGVLAAGTISDRWFASRRGPVVFAMTAGLVLATLALWGFGQHNVVVFTGLLGVIGFMAMGPDSLLSGAGAVDVGDRRQAAMAVGIINGLGSIGPIVQEPVIGWLKSGWGASVVYDLLVAVSMLAVLGVGLLWASARRSGVDW